MKIPILVASFVAAFSVASAQPETEYLKTKALSLGFGGMSGVGGKIWISDRQALVLSVGGDFSSNIQEAADSTDIDDKYNRSDVDLSLALEQHIDLGKGFSPYLGGGLSVGFGRSTNTYGTKATPYESESRAVSFGARAGLGVEYWVTRRVSISGQQWITGTYGLGKYRNGLAGSPSSETRSFTLDLATSALVLSMYL